MGGTGGPGGSREQAQQGLQGAGLLSGDSLAPNTTARALGVEGAAQPTTAQLAGTATGSAPVPVPVPVPLSASDTPSAPAPVVTPSGAGTPFVPPPVAAGPATTPFQLAPVTNLGFPTADMPLGTVGHVPFGAAAPTAAPTVSAAPIVSGSGSGAGDGTGAAAQSPNDWLYPGHLPMNFDERAGVFGMPWKYSATGPNQTAGYGAVGGFGGVAGYGPPQQGLQPQVLLPELAAGTQLKDAQIDQYNRVSRADYDRYMKLYGVGYDLPAYRNALNGLVYQQNMQNYGGTGGG